MDEAIKVHLSAVAELVDKLESVLCGNKGAVCVDALISLLAESITKCVPLSERQGVVDFVAENLNEVTQRRIK